MPNRLESMLPASLVGTAQCAAFLALVGAISLVQISLWISERFVEAAILISLWIWFREGKPSPARRPFLLPLGLFFIWTMIAALATSDVMAGVWVIKKFYLLLLLFLIPPIVRGAERTAWIYRAVFVVAAISSIAGVAQFIANPRRDLLHRIAGFQSTWMSYSGQLMLVLVALAAWVLVFGMRKSWWALLLGPLTFTALILTFTRNAWAGAIAGIGVVLLLLRPRLLPIFIALLLSVYLVLPASLQRRLQSTWDPRDPNTRNRIELSQTAVRLIRDNPWLGVGPEYVAREALRYRGQERYLDWMYQHMHNNFLQIAAERGIPGLILWLWFMGRLAWDAFLIYRRARNNILSGEADSGVAESAFVSAAALGAWAAILVAGLGEYNFSTSVVLIPFLFMMSAPYSYLQDRVTTAGPDGQTLRAEG